jgi:hypothetical protein
LTVPQRRWQISWSGSVSNCRTYHRPPGPGVVKKFEFFTRSHGAARGSRARAPHVREGLEILRLGRGEEHRHGLAAVRGTRGVDARGRGDDDGPLLACAGSKQEDSR